MLPVIHFVYGTADHSGNRHQSYYDYIHDKVHHHRVVFLVIIIVVFLHLHLIYNKCCQTCNYQKDSQNRAKKYILHTKFDVVMAMFACYSTHVLPHNVSHGRGKEAVLDIEGVQVVVGIFEDATRSVAALTLIISISRCKT